MSLKLRKAVRRLLSRRDLLRAGGATLAGLGVLTAWRSLRAGTPGENPPGGDPPSNVAPPPPAEGAPLRLDPDAFLTAFNDPRFVRTQETDLGSGRKRREFWIEAHDSDQTVEVAPGVEFPGWTFNRTIPGPTLRATEGDEVVVHFTNAGKMAHTMHFHGFHPANMDGVREIVNPGKSFEYRFIADPFGVHLYHCHTPPLRQHIQRGLYGVFIVDPKGGRPHALAPRDPGAKVKEMVMVMNGYDLDFDGENEFYTVNGVANHHMPPPEGKGPIRLKAGELVRVYLVNITEFDPINSLHTHATFFHYYPTGTSLTPRDFTDTVMLCQGERGILEFTYREPGDFMFHAHQSEFADLGWVGFFRVEA